MHLMSVAGIPFYHVVDLISQNCLAGYSGLTAALGNYILAPTRLYPQLAYSRVIPLDHYCFPLSLLISYPVLLSQLDWLFSYGTWMTEHWWVHAPALPPFCKCLYSGVRVLVSTLIYLKVRSFGLLVISRFRSFHRLSPIFRCCKRKELPLWFPCVGIL